MESFGLFLTRWLALRPGLPSQSVTPGKRGLGLREQLGSIGSEEHSNVFPNDLILSPDIS